MNLKHRVQNFWKYFETIREDLETALKQQDSHEYGHILEDLNSQLKRIRGCKMEVEMSETGFFDICLWRKQECTVCICFIEKECALCIKRRLDHQ